LALPPQLLAESYLPVGGLCGTGAQVPGFPQQLPPLSSWQLAMGTDPTALGQQDVFAHLLAGSAPLADCGAARWTMA